MALSLSLAFLVDSVGGSELGLVMLLILVLFGGKKLPEFARGLGKSIREFKKAAAGVEEEFKRALEEDERAQNAKPALPVTSPPAALPPAHTTPANLIAPAPDASLTTPPPAPAPDTPPPAPDHPDPHH